MQSIANHGAHPGADQPAQTAAIQAALDATGRGGGTVLIPPGIWITGTIRIPSRVELHLAHGAVLRGSGRLADYPEWFPEGVVVSRRPFARRLVLACQAEDVAITGSGTIDGAHGCRGELSQGECQPLNLQFIACSRVTVRDVTLRDAGSWMQQLLACDTVRLAGLTISNHGNRTNDGLDLDGCQGVRISDCDIDSHDDALVFKSTGPRPCRDILVSHCRLRSNCHGIKCGTESVGGFERLRINHCLVSPSRHPAPMEDFPAGRPVITGCALECTDGGILRDVVIEGLMVERVFAPVFIRLGNRHQVAAKGTPRPDGPVGPGILEGVTIAGLVARDCGPLTSAVAGYPGHPLRGIRLIDWDLACRGGATADDILDAVEENSAGYPEVNMFGNKGGKHLPAWGLYARHVQGLDLADLRFRLTTADARRPLVLDDVTELHRQDLRANDEEGRPLPCT